MASARSRSLSRLELAGKSKRIKWAQMAQPCAVLITCAAIWQKEGTHDCGDAFYDEKPSPASNTMNSIETTSDSTGKDTAECTRENSCGDVQCETLGLFVLLIPNIKTSAFVEIEKPAEVLPT
jgi:hypothetical protein